MKRKKIKRIVVNQGNELAKLCAEVGDHFNKDIIHDFRVSYKALRSLLRLLQSCNDDHLGIPKSVKKRYHLAGSIRDAQLETGQLANTELPKYKSALQQLLGKRKRDWRKQHPKKAIRKLKNLLLKKEYVELHPDLLSTFFRRQMKAIDARIKTMMRSDNSIHTVRKHVKDILYIARFANNNWKGANDIVATVPIKRLDTLAGKIGDYNDKRLLLEHLQSFVSNARRLAEQQEIRKISDLMSIELLAAKKEIIHYTRKLSHPNAQPAI